jgi:RNA polymerase sigma factor (sigma-70 family)
MHEELPLARYFQGLTLWISPVDDQGCPADPAFLRAAEHIGGDFFRYRAREINDPSHAMELAERAVHQASRAKKKRPVEDPVAYLFRTFTNLVDDEIERSKRLCSFSDEHLHIIGPCSAASSPVRIERTILWREILDSVDPTMQWVLWRLYWGFSINEIADELGIPPNTLSKRLSRLRKQLKKALDRQRPTARTSWIDEKRRAPRIEPGRGLRAAGADGT